MKTKNLVCFFYGLLVCILLSSCGGGENKAIKTAKSLVFFPDTYEAGYQLGDVVETTMKDVSWEAKKIDSIWIVTLTGKIARTERSSEYEKKLMEKAILSFNFGIEGNYGEVIGGGAYYDGEYEDADADFATTFLRVIYTIHDYIMKNEN